MSREETFSLDLEAYLRRVGYSGELRPTLAVLDALHLAHSTQVPFENLDIQVGRPIRIDLESVQAKLVHGRRGGYCFEQNTLFAAVLEHLGFQLTPLLARVRVHRQRPMPRTHMVLKVDIDNVSYLTDVGFGTGGLLRPILFNAGKEVIQFAWRHRLIEEPGLWVLQSWTDNVWQDLYAFTLEPQLPVDFEAANWYTSTHPDSRFVRTVTAQRSTPQVRYTLRNRELVITEGDRSTTRTIADDEELLRVLAEIFDLHFPAGTRFRAMSPASEK
jgi:N-hydroxyarylamine O-acetyltransferase